MIVVSMKHVAMIGWFGKAKLAKETERKLHSPQLPMSYIIASPQLVDQQEDTFLNLLQQDRTCIISLLVTLHDFIRQGVSSLKESVNGHLDILGADILILNSCSNALTCSNGKALY